jgi:O-antigen/teichoic acid export membrane protein
MLFDLIKDLTRVAFSEGGSLHQRVIRSGLWVAASQVMLSGLGVARSIILARLLSPEVFGLMGLAQIAMRTVETLTRPGIGEALIARRQSFESAGETAFTLLVARGAVLTALLWLLAPVVASFYQSEALTPVIRALSISLLVGGFCSINTVARSRDLEFRRLTYLGQAAAWASFIVTVSAAYWLRSVWALVFGQLAAAVVTTVLSYFLVGGRLRFGFDRAVARELLSYGKFITGASIVLFIASELDSALIGKYLGIVQLGYYTLAATIAQIVTTQVSKIISGVMLPAYSRLQDDLVALRQTFLRTVSLVVFLVLPATVGLILVAEPLIAVVYGDRWLPAAAPLQITAVFGLFMSLVALNGYLFQGIAVPSIAFKLASLRLAIIAVLLIPMMEQHGLVGAAWTVTFAIAVQWLAGLYFLRRHVAVTVSQLLRFVWRPVWTSLTMGLAVFALSEVISVRTAVGLLVSSATGLFIYAFLNWKYIWALRSSLRET